MHAASTRVLVYVYIYEEDRYRPGTCSAYPLTVSRVFTPSMSSHGIHPIFNNEISAIEQESTNETASDLPGAGRIVGNLYSFLGKKVERILNSIAEKRGHGPGNAAERIRSSREWCYDWRSETVEWQYPSDQERQRRKDCKKLIHHTRQDSIFSLHFL